MSRLCYLIALILMNTIFAVNCYANVATTCQGKNCPVIITYNGTTKPCTGQDCPLPANFDYIISCCSNSASDRQHFTIVEQRVVANQQELIYEAHYMRQQKFISQNTYQMIMDYVQWVANVTNQPIKDWPDIDGTEWKSREHAVVAAIHHDESTSYLDRVLCYFSDKYCR